MSSSAGPSIITNSLILHLDAADRKSYPGSGTVWRDRSGNGINGTLTNGPTFSGVNGGSLVFDGVNDFVNNNNISIINRLDDQEITVSCWIKPSRTSGQYSVFCANRLRFGAGNDTYNWMFYQHTTDGAISFHGDSQNKSSYIPSLNIWINVVNTVNSSRVSTLYVNALPVYVINNYTYGNGTPSVLSIGADSDSEEAFQGNISQVSIYNKALSPAEIKQNFNATKSRFGLL
jgi:hypothetical protein